MKKIISFLLSLAIVLVCFSPLTAFALNETTGSTNVRVELQPPTNTDSGTSYSYLVNIPANFTLSYSNSSFQITASEMNIPVGKELVVRINSDETFERDGNFYLFLNGDKSSEYWILCNICRVQGYITSIAYGENPIIASFSPGALLPNNCDYIRLEHAIYNDGTGLEAGTYTGTIYYTIGLE